VEAEVADGSGGKRTEARGSAWKRMGAGVAGVAEVAEGNAQHTARTVFSKQSVCVCSEGE